MFLEIEQVDKSKFSNQHIQFPFVEVQQVDSSKFSKKQPYNGSLVLVS